jgi:hypothetical protein
VGAFRPQLRKWLRLDDEDQSNDTLYPERGIDRNKARQLILLVVVRKVISLPSKAVAFLVNALLWRPLLGPIVERFVLRVVASVFRLMATGLHPQEMRQGRRIVVAERIGVPAIFNEEHFWEATPSALAMPSFRTLARDIGRYKFLVSGAELPEPEEKQSLFRALRQQGVSDSEMLKTALMVDERVREAVGAVQLAHSLYYGNEEVIRRVATFVSTGTTAQIVRSTNHALTVVWFVSQYL